MGKSEKYIKRLADILLSEMGKDELTNAEMAKKCGISKRKFGEIIYGEDKGLRFETFVVICESARIEYNEIFNIS